MTRINRTWGPLASAIASSVSSVAVSDFVLRSVRDRIQMQLLVLHCSRPFTSNSSIQEMHCCLLQSTRTVLAAGYRFTEQGISSCAINTSQPVGTVFAVSFVVYDLSIPSRSASVTRTIQIVNPCDAGQVLCSDGSCSRVACKFRSVMPAMHDIASEPWLIQAFLLQGCSGTYVSYVISVLYTCCAVALAGLHAEALCSIVRARCCLALYTDTAVHLLQVSQIC